MCHDTGFDFNFFSDLRAWDLKAVKEAQSSGCPWCQWRLDRSDYARKPRGGLLCVEGEMETKRFSLCCSQEGCRKRVTPVSLRFLGRRVYLGVAVILASCLFVEAPQARAKEHREKTGVPARTIRRWVQWWQCVFVSTRFYAGAKGDFATPVDKNRMPQSLLERFSGQDLAEQVKAFIKWLSPLSIATGINGSPMAMGN